MHVSYLNIKPCSFVAVIYLSSNLNERCSYKVKILNKWIKIKQFFYLDLAPTWLIIMSFKRWYIQQKPTIQSLITQVKSVV